MNAIQSLKHLTLGRVKAAHSRRKLRRIPMVYTLSAQYKQRTMASLLGFALALGLVSTQAFPQTAIGSVNLPSTPAFPQGQDKVRAADGTECSRSTAPRSKWMEVGVVGTGTGGQGVENSYPYVGYNGMVPTAQPYSRAGGAVYGRIIINLDANQSEIDCNHLYILEIERLKAELEQAKLIGIGKAIAK